MSIFWLLGILLVLICAIVTYNYLAQRRFLKKKTSETMGPAVRRDIEQEREQNLQRRGKFQKELKRAQGDQKQE